MLSSCNNPQHIHKPIIENIMMASTTTFFYFNYFKHYKTYDCIPVSIRLYEYPKCHLKKQRKTRLSKYLSSRQISTDYSCSISRLRYLRDMSYHPISFLSLPSNTSKKLPKPLMQIKSPLSLLTPP